MARADPHPTKTLTHTHTYRETWITVATSSITGGGQRSSDGGRGGETTGGEFPTPGSAEVHQRVPSGAAGRAKVTQVTKIYRTSLPVPRAGQQRFSGGGELDKLREERRVKYVISHQVRG